MVLVPVIVVLVTGLLPRVEFESSPFVSTMDKYVENFRRNIHHNRNIHRSWKIFRNHKTLRNHKIRIMFSQICFKNFNTLKKLNLIYVHRHFSLILLKLVNIS